jgi:hypothetical protein
MVTLANTSQSAPANTSCGIADTLVNWSWWIQWDTHSCGTFNNITWYANNTLGCNYCSYNLTNTTASAPANTTAVYSNVTECNVSGNLTQYANWTQWSWWIRYDTNATTCCAVTGLGSDCVNNVTSYNNVSWGNWSVLGCTYYPPAPSVAGRWLLTLILPRPGEPEEIRIGLVRNA